jgi:hypothetical protein
MKKDDKEKAVRVAELLQLLTEAVKESAEVLATIIRLGIRDTAVILDAVKPVLEILATVHLRSFDQADRERLHAFLIEQIEESEDFPRSHQELVDVVRTWLSSQDRLRQAQPQKDISDPSQN